MRARGEGERKAGYGQRLVGVVPCGFARRLRLEQHGGEGADACARAVVAQQLDLKQVQDIT